MYDQLCNVIAMFLGGLNGLNGLNESSLIWDLRESWTVFGETPLESHQEAQEFRSVAANARQVAQARSQERAMQAGNLTSALLPAVRNPSQLVALCSA